MILVVMKNILFTICCLLILPAVSKLILFILHLLDSLLISSLESAYFKRQHILWPFYLNSLHLPICMFSSLKGLTSHHHGICILLGFMCTTLCRKTFMSNFAMFLDDNTSTVAHRLTYIQHK